MSNNTEDNMTKVDTSREAVEKLISNRLDCLEHECRKSCRDDSDAEWTFTEAPACALTCPFVVEIRTAVRALLDEREALQQRCADMEYARANSVRALIALEAKS